MARTDLVQCADCHGYGGVKMPILDFGEGPIEPCGFCKETGRTTKMMNCWLMRWRKDGNFQPKDEDIAVHEAAMRHGEKHENNHR